MTLHDLLEQTMKNIAAEMGEERRKLKVEALGDRLIISHSGHDFDIPASIQGQRAEGSSRIVHARRSLSLTTEEAIWLYQQIQRIYVTHLEGS